MPIHKEESKWKRRIFTGVIFVVLISSVIGFTFSAIPFGASGLGRDSNTLTYSGREFIPTQNGLATIIDEQIFEFTYYPDELGSVDTGDIASKITSSRMVYATSHPNSTFASEFSGLEFDIGRVLESNYDSFMEVAFTAGNPYGKTIITCADATPFIPVVFFNYTNTTTEVVTQNNCIIVNVASENSFKRIRDKIIYELLEVEP